MKKVKLRVLLADEFPIVLTGLRTLLGETGDMEVVGETERSHEVGALVERTGPDVLVVDARMAQAAELFRARRLPARVLVLCHRDDVDAVAGEFPADAVGLLTKDAPVELILDGVRRVAHGETGWLWRDKAGEEPASRLALTVRERAILQLVAAGKTNHEIGVTLGISDRIVEKHLSVLFDKLAVGSRVEAAVAAVQHGLV